MGSLLVSTCYSPSFQFNSPHTFPHSSLLLLPLFSVFQIDFQLQSRVLFCICDVHLNPNNTATTKFILLFAHNVCTLTDWMNECRIKCLTFVNRLIWAFWFYCHCHWHWYRGCSRVHRYTCVCVCIYIFLVNNPSFSVKIDVVENFQLSIKTKRRTHLYTIGYTQHTHYMKQCV